MNEDNNANRQNLGWYTQVSTLRYHRGANEEMMNIIKRRDNSPETRELVEKRIETDTHALSEKTEKFQSLEDPTTPTERN